MQKKVIKNPDWAFASMIIAMAVLNFIIGKNQIPASADGRTIECSNNDTGDFEIAVKFMNRSL